MEKKEIIKELLSDELDKKEFLEDLNIDELIDLGLKASTQLEDLRNLWLHRATIENHDENNELLEKDPDYKKRTKVLYNECTSYLRIIDKIKSTIFTKINSLNISEKEALFFDLMTKKIALEESNVSKEYYDSIINYLNKNNTMKK